MKSGPGERIGLRWMRQEKQSRSIIGGD